MERTLVEFRLRKGKTINLGPSPGDTPVIARTVRKVGVMARDYPGVIFDLRVREGDRVRRGQLLCVDRHRPEIGFVASVSGRVHQIRQGARRRIEAIVVNVEGDEGLRFDVGAAAQNDGALRNLLLKSGAWLGFRTRPFGRIPDPADRPSAIFITATDSNPLAPDPTHVLRPLLDSFRRGAQALSRLTDDPVFVCQAPGPSLIDPSETLQVVRFSGPHPSGLPGTHIHHLWPVSDQRSVWQIGYQDVAAIGTLLSSGEATTTRTISVAGPGVERPALVRAPLGAELIDLLGEPRTDETLRVQRLVSGFSLTGTEARFLSRHDLQVTVFDRNATPKHTRTALWRMIGRLPLAVPGATQPSEAFERLFPFDLLPVPLMRALAVGDIETVERLGGLELLEEDLALLTWRCPSGTDYGQLLRGVLDTLHQERAA
ncbi:hypothetical protein [Sulfitobacter indolifex]|uniref:hypothetical protein n=1 Tax=Sulfitobacter indolifex TaxID=225422 RepID=UPI000594EC5F|nr:hypothetical protein [Sulfitobacter indolifex]